MKHMKIGVRLALGFGAVMALMLVIIGIGLLRLTNMYQITDTIVTKDWQKTVLVNNVIALVNDNARANMELFLVTEQAQMTKLLERVENNKTKITAVLEQVDSMLYRPEGKALLEKIKEARKPYVGAFTRGAKLFVGEGKREEANHIIVHEMVPALKAFLGALDALIDFQGKLLDAHGVEAEHNYDSARTLMFVLGVAALVLGASFAFWVTRSITRPMAVAVRVAEGIATGELTHNITLTSRDEVGRLMQAMQSMSEKLQQIVGEIRLTSTHVATAASEIVQGNMSLSQRTQEQASALEETASSMEEMTSSVKQNADNAHQANQLAAGARTQAEQGGEVVNKAVAAMADISQSSKKIADIISVIDGIAFQTNLLALNAAVEAARAGEQGRGFAVVAAEVRKLAQRSADAAKEIKTLIVDSVDKVEGGTRLVDESGKTLSEIVMAVKKVSDIVAEIAAASQEQSAGIEQVNKAVMQMDEMTQQNAALVEEAAAASESVDAQAQSLQQLIEFFKVDERVEEQGSKVAAGRPASPPTGHQSADSATHTPMQPAQAHRPVAPSSTPGAKPGATRKETVAQHTNGHQRVGATSDGADSDWIEF